MRYSLSPHQLLPATLLVVGLGLSPLLIHQVRAQSACAPYITSQGNDDPFEGTLQGSHQVTEEVGGSLGVSSTEVSGSRTITYEVGTYRDYATKETVTVRCDTYEQLAG